MKHLALIVFFSLALTARPARAKPSVTVMRFKIHLPESSCQSTHKGNLDDSLAWKLVRTFARSSRLNVTNLNRSNRHSRSQYLVKGTVRSFQRCRARRARHQTARVAIDLQVIERRSGKIAFHFTSSASATGSTLNMDQVTQAVLDDLAYQVEQALIFRKDKIHIVRKRARQIASEPKLSLKLIPEKHR